MPYYLDLETWPRREVFEFYRRFDKPYFNVCLRLDVTELLLELKRRDDRPSVWLTYHYLALRAANDIEPFRYRLRDGKVLVHEVINGGTTLILPNETFTLVYFDHSESYREFMDGATRAVDEIRAGDWKFLPKHEDDARIHCTTLPWIAFTSFPMRDDGGAGKTPFRRSRLESLCRSMDGRSCRSLSKCTMR